MLMCIVSICNFLMIYKNTTLMQIQTIIKILQVQIVYTFFFEFKMSKTISLSITEKIFFKDLCFLNN